MLFINHQAKPRAWFNIEFLSCRFLTHWGRVTHICGSKLTIIGSDNGLSPGWHQAIIWTSAGILLIRTPGTNFSEILSESYTFSLKKMHFKMAAILSRPQCVNWFNALTRFTLGIPILMKYKLFILEIRRRSLDHPWSVWKVYIYEICIEFVYIRGYFSIRLHVILIFVSYVYIYFIGVNVSSNKSHVNKSAFGNFLSMKYFSFISRVIVITCVSSSFPFSISSLCLFSIIMQSLFSNESAKLAE